MDLIPWRPERGLASLRREMNWLFRRFFEEEEEWPIETWKGKWAPALDVEETEDEIMVKAEIPGVDPKDIELTIAGDCLRIRGEKKQEKEEKKKNYHRIERNYGAFQRSVRLPAEIDSEKAKADYKKGVLHITLPKVEKARSKEIKIEIK